jgi:hypothetical protein
MTSLQGNFGWAGPAPIDILGTNRTGSAVAVGDVEMLDVFRDQAESVGNINGSSVGGLASCGQGNFVVPIAKARQVGIFAVMMQAAADDANVRGRLAGQVDACQVSATVVLTTPTIFVSPLSTENALLSVPVIAGTASAGQGIPSKIIFIPLTARTGAGVTDGWFNGITGFGATLETS